MIYRGICLVEPTGIHFSIYNVFCFSAIDDFIKNRDTYDKYSHNVYFSKILKMGYSIFVNDEKAVMTGVYAQNNFYNDERENVIIKGICDIPVEFVEYLKDHCTDDFQNAIKESEKHGWGKLKVNTHLSINIVDGVVKDPSMNIILVE